MGSYVLQRMVLESAIGQLAYVLFGMLGNCRSVGGIVLSLWSTRVLTLCSQTSYRWTLRTFLLYRTWALCILSKGTYS